jgi:hypothetical protein
MNTSRLTRNRLPRQAVYVPLVPGASLLVARINVYKMHTDSTSQSPEEWCSDSVASERYGSSQGGYTVYDGMFTKQDDLAG